MSSGCVNNQQLANKLAILNRCHCCGCSLLCCKSPEVLIPSPTYFPLTCLQTLPLTLFLAGPQNTFSVDLLIKNSFSNLESFSESRLLSWQQVAFSTNEESEGEKWRRRQGEDGVMCQEETEMGWGWEMKKRKKRGEETERQWFMDCRYIRGPRTHWCMSAHICKQSASSCLCWILNWSLD